MNDFEGPTYLYVQGNRNVVPEQWIFTDLPTISRLRNYWMGLKGNWKYNDDFTDFTKRIGRNGRNIQQEKGR